MTILERRKSFLAFLETVRPIDQIIVEKLRPFKQAAELLVDLVDADDPKETLTAYGDAMRKAYPNNADKRIRLDLVEVSIKNDFQEEYRSISQELLIGSIANHWTALNDLNANFTGGARWQILDMLAAVAYSVNTVIEQQLIEAHRPMVIEEMSKHGLSFSEVESFSEGRKDVPRFILTLIENQEEEVEKRSTPNVSNHHSPPRAILSVNDLATLPKPDDAPDPIHRMIYYLQAGEAFLIDAVAAETEEQYRATAFVIRSEYWTPFWKKYVAADDAVAYLRGDATIFIKQQGLNPSDFYARLHEIAVSILNLTRMIPLRRREIEVGFLQQCYDAIRGSIGFLRSVLEIMGIAFVPWSVVNKPSEMPANSLSAKPKKSTAKGEAPAKIIAALTAHHQYENGSVGFYEPIGVNELAQQAGVGAASVTRFFNKRFAKNQKDTSGHEIYMAMVAKAPQKLIASLKSLNGEYQPHSFVTARTPAEFEDSIKNDEEN